jgi:antitoxin component of MazEF toxin-antitoxin module
MVKHLRKVGNSNAILLDKPLMELIGLEEGGAVQVAVENNSIRLTPISPRRVPQELFETVTKQVMRERKTLLRRLAQ